MIAFVYLIPVLAIAIINVFKHVVGEFEARELALELHITGITMIAPPLLLKPDIVEILMLIIVVDSMMLIVTGAFYVKIANNPRKTSCERIEMIIGAISFSLGFALAILLP